MLSLDHWGRGQALELETFAKQIPVIFKGEGLVTPIGFEMPVQMTWLQRYND